MTGITPQDTRVPEDERGIDCPHCGRPFADARARDLHVGEAHPDDCTDDQRDAYEAAADAEHDDLFIFHMKAVVLIGLSWAIFVVLYMVALGSGIL